MKRAWAFALALLSALSLHAQAQTQTLAQAQTQTLAQALDEAWARAPQAGAFAARETEAKAGAELAANLLAAPASVSLSTLNDRLGSGEGLQEWEVELTLPLWLPGQRAARETQAQSAGDEVAARRRALRLQLAGELREAWWTLAASRAAAALARQRVETAAALEADVQRRVKAGDLARVDANLATGERLAAQAAQIDAAAALRSATQVWRNLTGNPPPATLAPEAPAAPSAADDHPLLAAARAASRSAQSRLAVTEATRRDAPELALRYFRERPTYQDEVSHAVGVKLTVPFSSGARMQQESAGLRAELAQAEGELEQARRKLALDAESARLDLDAARERITLARERRDLGADTLRLAQKSFALGETGLPALLLVRAAAVEADAQLAREEVGADAAQSRLNQALGVLP